MGISVSSSELSNSNLPPCGLILILRGSLTSTVYTKDGCRVLLRFHRPSKDFRTTLTFLSVNCKLPFSPPFATRLTFFFTACSKLSCNCTLSLPGSSFRGNSTLNMRQVAFPLPLVFADSEKPLLVDKCGILRNPSLSIIIKSKIMGSDSMILPILS